MRCHFARLLHLTSFQEQPAEKMKGIAKLCSGKLKNKLGAAQKSKYLIEIFWINWIGSGVIVIFLGK